MEELYNTIFKRKSVRKYDETLRLSEEELSDIKNRFTMAKPLIADIPVSIKIVKREETTCKIGEYCLLFYSEEKEGYLLNAGYMLEQIDLYMASVNIGACWYGWGKTKEKEYNGQKFVIMIAFGKCEAESFRLDYTKAKRRELDKIWSGDEALEVAEIIRYTPSACNSQPWRVVSFVRRLEIFRAADITSKLSGGLIKFFNKIDMGIFMCFMDITLTHFGYNYTKKLLCEDKSKSPIPVAVYTIEKQINE